MRYRPWRPGGSNIGQSQRPKLIPQILKKFNSVGTEARTKVPVKKNDSFPVSKNDSELFSADELSSLVQEALGRDRFGSQDLGNAEDFGMGITDNELNELLGSAFRGTI